MRPATDSRGQLWNFTGESRLQNFAEDDLFLTVNSDKSLVFKKRDSNNVGQIWEPGWHPTSKRFANQAINIYGGRNVNGANVGLYPKSKSGNEEWRRTSDNSCLQKPTCLRIEMHPEAATVETYDEKGEDNNYAARWVQKNHTEFDVIMKYEKTITKTKETSSSNTQNVQLEASYEASIEGTVGVEGIASAKVGVKYGFTAAYGRSFTKGESTVSSERDDWTIEITVPAKSGVEITVVGKKVKFRIPYTMKFDDGSNLDDFLTHVQSHDLESETRAFSLE